MLFDDPLYRRLFGLPACLSLSRKTRKDDGAVPEIGIATAGLFDLIAVGVPFTFGLAAFHEFYDLIFVHFVLLKERFSTIPSWCGIDQI